MITPYEYREFYISGLCDQIKTAASSRIYYLARAFHPKLEGVYESPGESWEEAKANIETGIDELIASWN